MTPQVEKLSSEIAISDEWYQFCQAQIQEWREEEISETQEELENAHKILEANRNRLERLLDLEIDGEISTNEYKSKKNEIVIANSHLEGKINKITQEGSSWFELIKSALETSNQAHHRIKDKDYSGMQKILKKTGSNSVLHDQEFSLTFSRPFIFFREAIILTGKCSSPKNPYLKNNLETQLKSGVGSQSRSRRRASLPLVGGCL